MKLLSYKINKYGKKPFFGVILHDGRQWLSLKYNITDYELDGICFVNKHFLKDLREVDADSMISKIIPLKYTEYDKDYAAVNIINLDDYKDFFNWLKLSGQLIEIGLQKNDSFYVGIVRDVLEKSFIIKSIDPEANDEGKRRIAYSKVRYIKINTEYVKSLSLYINWKGKGF